MRRRLLCPLLAVFLVAVVTAPAHSAELHDDGWWWRAQSGVLVDLPPPPHVPEDALVVSNGPDGPTAIAAVRFRLDDDEMEPILILRVHDARGTDPEIIACPITEVWFGDRAGQWEDAPAHTCDAAIAIGTPSDDGETWQFSLTALVRGAHVDVVLRPPEGTDGIFEVVFEAPESTSLETRRDDDDFEVPPVEPAPDTAPPPTSGDGGAPWETESAPAITFGPGDDHPTDQEKEEAPPVVADEPTPPADAAPPSETTSEPPPTATAATTGTAGLNDRLLAALLLAVGLLVLADLAWQKAPAPRRLGAAACGPARVVEAPPRGLGRFRRLREGSATPLV